MLMPKENRRLIYKYLFEEGVLVALKDVHQKSHPNIKNVPTLHVIKAMQSLKSRGYVKEQFAWRHYYWFLTSDGLTYLREYLNLPAEVIPNTYHQQKQVREQAPRARPLDRGARPFGEGARPYRPPGFGAGGEKDVGMAAGARIEYRGGYGRGAGGGFGAGAPGAGAAFPPS